MNRTMVHHRLPARRPHLPFLFASGAVALVLASCAAGDGSRTPTADRAPSTASTLATPPVSPAAPTTNTVDMQFIPVPAGRFLMGAPADAEWSSRQEQTQHEVTLTEGFEIGMHEVTQSQWQAVMGSDSNALPRSNSFGDLPGMDERIHGSDHPATVSWEDAGQFVARLNQLEGTDRYRLPTEAEWEYAARAGTTTKYSFGDDDADLSEYAWYGGDFATGNHHPVGQKAPNPWGLYDVHGNVWEWTQDFYSADGYTSSALTDPSGPATGSQHTVRGGSWHSTADGWSSSFRKGYDPGYRGISIGFRVVRTSL